MKTLGVSSISSLAILTGLFAVETQNCAGQEERAGMQIQGRPVAAWVAEVNIEAGLLDTDPALNVLVSAGPSVLTHLAAILEHDPSPTQQAKAADAIGVIAYRNPGKPELLGAVSALASSVENKDVPVRRFAVQGLGAIGQVASNAIPALIRSTKDEDRGVRMCAVEALGRIGIATPQTVGALDSSMSDPSGDVQVIAVQALYKIGRPATNTVPVLIQLTRNEEVGTRCLAVQILGRVGTNSPEAVVALKLALNDESKQFVRPLAREALTRLEAKEE